MTESTIATRTEGSAEPALLSVRGATKIYGRMKALDEVDFDVRAGEIHALLGANGAGKSTLVKVLAGLVRPDAGTTSVNGRVLEFRSIRDSLAANIRVVHQELSVFPTLTVGQNLVAGALNLGMSRDELRTGYRELHREWGIDLPQDAVARSLSPVSQAIVSLSKSLVGRSDVLILDEPTAALSSREVDGLFRIVRRKAAEGCAIIFVSHRLREVAELCDSVTVLRNGRKVHSGAIEAVDQHQLAELIVTGQGADRKVREAVANSVPVGMDVQERRRAADSVPALSVRDLQVGRRVIDVSFDVAPGEIVGLAGLVGSGRTEVLEAIVGFRPPTAGVIELDGEAYRAKNPYDAMSKGIALVPEERAAQALFPQRDIGFNFSATRFRREGRGPGGWLSARRRYDATSKELGDDLMLKSGGLRAGILSLSGGNQQKVVLGRTLIPELKLLLLDEPTRGVDVGARREFEAIIRGLADRGVAVVYVASELAELQQCDRIVVMVEGCTTTEGAVGADFDEEALTRLTFIPRETAVTTDGPTPSESRNGVPS